MSVRTVEVTIEKPTDLRPGDECVYDVRCRQWETYRADDYAPPAPPSRSCTSCGAPQEPVCSYCGTPA